MTTEQAVHIFFSGNSEISDIVANIDYNSLDLSTGISLDNYMDKIPSIHIIREIEEDNPNSLTSNFLTKIIIDNSLVIIEKLNLFSLDNNNIQQVIYVASCSSNFSLGNELKKRGLLNHNSIGYYSLESLYTIMESVDALYTNRTK